MEPFKEKLLPITYKIDKETIRLLGLANKKYGEYKFLLKMFEFASAELNQKGFNLNTLNSMHKLLLSE